MEMIVLREVAHPELCEWEWITCKDTNVHELEDGIYIRSNALESQYQGIKPLRPYNASSSYVRYKTLNRL